MLTASFCCFRGISPEAEGRLWREGFLCWADVLRTAPRCLSPARTAALRRDIEVATIAREAGLLGYFIARFPPAHRIRLLSEAGAHVVFLDIETTGLGRTASITTLAICRPDGCRVYVAEQDLPLALADLGAARMVVTYNGARFDLPIIERHFSFGLPLPHLDLCPVLHAHGYRGGLKACEQLLGGARGTHAVQDGAEAVTLWERWMTTRDGQALTRLVLYNARDACSLQRLARHAYLASLSAYPFAIRPPPALAL